MKKMIFAIFIMALPFALLGQNTSQNNLLNRLSGLEQGKLQYYSLGSTTFTIRPLQQSFSKESIDSLKLKYQLEKPDREYSIDTISIKNTIIVKERPNEQIIHTMYLFEKGKGMELVGITSNIAIRDTLDEIEFVNLYLNHKIPTSIIQSFSSDTINFAGRKVDVSKINKCEWMNLNSMQCSRQGQVSWSVHRTLENAKKATLLQYKSTANNSISKILSEKEVKVVFEEKNITAKHSIFEMTIPPAYGGGTLELQVYYITTQIRGQYISCILSHYSDDVLNENGLPALLAKVMTLK